MTNPITIVRGKREWEVRAFGQTFLSRWSESEAGLYARLLSRFYVAAIKNYAEKRNEREGFL